MFFFFFQAEDGIRDGTVTGVQTCALPISRSNDGNFGRVEAIDLKTRQVVWSERQRAPIASSLLASAGGVVFSGARDRHFRAYDAATGKVLWLREYGCNIVAKIDYHSL